MRYLKPSALITAISALIIFLFLFCTPEPAGPDVSDEIKPKGSITGWVNDMWGKPIKDVIVSVNADSAVPGLSNAAGMFTIGKVQKGAYTLHFTHSEYEEDTTCTISLGQGEHDTIDTPVKLSYAYYIVQGSITMNSIPQSGAGVCVADYTEGMLTNPNGVFILRKVPKNSSVTLICAYGNVASAKKQMTGLIANDTNDIGAIALSEKGPTASGRVFFPDMKPAPNMTVFAVAGGLKTVTDEAGYYTLRNIPADEDGVVLMVNENGYIGAAIGAHAVAGAVITGCDIYLKPAQDLINKMKLVTCDVYVPHTASSVILRVYPVTGINTVIKQYNWKIGSAAYTTAHPACTVSVSGLSPKTTASVSANSTAGDTSGTETFFIFLTGTAPVIDSIAVSKDKKTYASSVTILEGEWVWFYVHVTNLFGGLKLMKWNFGDGTTWTTTDTNPNVGHMYGSAGTYHAVFTAKDADNNATSDSVTLIVQKSPLQPVTLLLPDSGAVLYIPNDTVVLKWTKSPVAGAVYNVYMCWNTTIPSETDIIAAGLTDTLLRTKVDSAKTYYWRVKTIRAGDSVYTWSLIRPFTVYTDIVNHPPRFISTPDSMTDTMYAGYACVDTLKATDPDCDSLVFSFITKPDIDSVKLIGNVLWYKPAVKDTGAHNASVKVSDPKGLTDTLAWTIRVLYGAPIIITHPQPKTVSEKDSVRFSVSARGRNLSFQWRKDTVNIVGATDPVYKINSVALTDSGLYRCIVANPFGACTSNAAKLTVVNVNHPPVFISTPDSMTGTKYAGLSYADTLKALDIDGDTLSFSFIKSASGMTLTKNIFSWSPGVKDTGKDTASVKVADGKGGTDTLTWVIMVINGAPVITKDPVSKTVYEKDSIIFYIAAKGDTLKYQWQKNSSNITGATDSVYKKYSATLADAGYYRCIIWNSFGKDTSDTAKLTVLNRPPVFVSTPDSMKDTMYAGLSYADTLKASDPEGDALGFSFISSVSGMTLSGNVFSWAPVVKDTGKHTVSVKVSDGKGGSDTLTWTITVINGAPDIVVHPMPKSVDEFTKVTFIISAKGNNLQYQWQKDGSDINGANDTAYTIDSVVCADSGLYRCIASNSFGKDTSNSAKLTVRPYVADILYVKSDATGSNNGTSWANAFNSVQSALDIAKPNSQIWVATGTYKPTKEQGGTGERFKSFSMKNCVGIYGGFNGTETQLSQRDWVNNVTICSGDIGVEGDSTDNCYHVFYHVQAMMIDNRAVIDGFTITKGNADDLSGNQQSYGGGMYNDIARPTINNCTFTGNYAFSYGGALCNNTNSAVKINNCRFHNNNGNSAGGGIYNGPGSSVLIKKCIISSNTNSLGCGGGIYNYSSSPIIDSTTFSLNTGSAMYNYGSNPRITNCNFLNNANSKGGALYSYSSVLTVKNCTFTGNTGGAISDLYSGLNNNNNYLIANCTFLSNTSTDYGGGIYINLGSKLRLINSTFSQNSTTYDGGGIYFNNGGGTDSSNIILNCIFWDNFSGTGSNEIYTGGTTPVVIKNNVIQGGFSDTMAVISNIITTDPKLGTLADNGGYVQTIATGSGSSALDKGLYVYQDTKNIFYNTDGGTSYFDAFGRPYTPVGQVEQLTKTDARGIPRPQGSGIDLGAYEKE